MMYDVLLCDTNTLECYLKLSMLSDACISTDGRFETNLGHGCMSTALCSAPFVVNPISTVRYIRTQGFGINLDSKHLK